MRFVGKLPDDFRKENGKTYVALVGSRKVNDRKFVEEKFNQIVDELKLNKENIILVSGGTEGVNEIARQIAKDYDIPIVEIAPDWNTHSRTAEFERNTEIVRLADVVIAIPTFSSVETVYTIFLAEETGKRLYSFEYKEN